MFALIDLWIVYKFIFGSHDLVFLDRVLDYCLAGRRSGSGVIGLKLLLFGHE